MKSRVNEGLTLPPIKVKGKALSIERSSLGLKQIPKEEIIEPEESHLRRSDSDDEEVKRKDDDDLV